MSDTKTTITKDRVEQVVIDAIASFGPDRQEITLDATFNDLDVDSLDLAELSQIVADEFDVDLTSNDVEQIKTVGDAVNIVLARA